MGRLITVCSALLSILNNNSKVPFREKPSLDQLRVHRCLCYATLPKKDRDKLQPKAEPSVLLGYPYTQEGYKLYGLISHRVYISRYVILHETYFRFHILTHKYSSFPYS